MCMLYPLYTSYSFPLLASSPSFASPSLLFSLRLLILFLLPHPLLPTRSPSSPQSTVLPPRRRTKCRDARVYVYIDAYIESPIGDDTATPAVGSQA
ncbi:hypothetical protein C8R45DRAFT_575208 [Mycena sanguinolenta]|nr:hypothetical protein C8R45DRAFT_575208 [Mycena sanguinolenta]